MHEWTALGCNGRSIEEVPSIKIEMKEWAEMGRTGGVLGVNCDEGVTAIISKTEMKVLVAIGGLLKNYQHAETGI